MKFRNAPIYVWFFIAVAVIEGCDNTIFPIQGSAPLVSDQEEFTRQIEVPLNAKILEFHHHGGNIKFVGWDQSYVLIQGTTRASAESVQMARAILDMVEITASEQPENRLVIDYEGPGNFGKNSNPDEGMDYTANIPYRMILDVQAENSIVLANSLQSDVYITLRDGDIQAETIQGNLTIEATGRKNAGDRVTVKSIERNIDLKTRHVDLDVDQINGETLIDHRVGEIRLTNLRSKVTLTGRETAVLLSHIQGLLQLDNEGGDVLCDNFYDGINAEIRNGTLRLEPKVPVTRSYDCTVKKGNLILRVPDNSNMLLELMAVNGSIHSEFPLQVSAEGKISYAKGAINQGFPSVKLDVEKGSISILREIPMSGSPTLSTSQPSFQEAPPKEPEVTTDGAIPVQNLLPESTRR